MSSIILGISAYYHDSAAVLLLNGEILAAAQEERFTRKKHDPSFPSNAIRYVLSEAGISLGDVNIVTFYDKPLLKFERLLETYHAFAPLGLKSFIKAIPVWIKEKLFLKKTIKEELEKIGPNNASLCFTEHHLSHAASAYYPSPFNEAAILTLDGVGEWATTTIGHGSNGSITFLKELSFPHSLGLLYSAFTYYCGFKVNSGEYKLMGLAPYGDSESAQTKEFVKLIETHLIDIKEDGSFLLNMTFFNFTTGLTMTHDSKWKTLFNIPRRTPETSLSMEHMNLALAIQLVTEKIVLKLASTAALITKSKNLVLAGGVALNCVANGKLLKSKHFQHIWIQPASGDAGGALGAAYATWHIFLNNKKKKNLHSDLMKGSYLGPSYSNLSIENLSKRFKAPFMFYDDINKLTQHIASSLKEGRIVGWFQGRMEFGPRALGARSILADSRNPIMQKQLNLKIKYREGFRPFAPAVLEEDLQHYFDLATPSPYMLFVAPVRQDICIFKKPTSSNLYDRLYNPRSSIPAVTHIDYSARIQSVNADTNPFFHQLLTAFKELTSSSVLINTSFNVRGEPIVCSPEDAYRCFMRTEMDVLVLNNFVFIKKNQPQWNEKSHWKEEFSLD